MDFIQIITVLFTSLINVSVGTSTSEKISLSPETWSQEEFHRLETISLRKNPRPKPLTFSDVEGLVAGTTSALAVHAGADALRKGGNAMDACIATAMAEIPLTAGAEVSFAGVANILFYHRVTGRVHNLDAGWKIPRNRNHERVPSLETLGDSVLVPGLLAGMFEAAEFSKYPLSTLLEPALFFAEKGFKMPHKLSKMVKEYYNKNTLLRTDKGLKIFTNPQTNKPYEPVELFRQPQLAKFIRNVQKNGKNHFYRGKWTKKLLGTLRAHGGYMTADDMARYEAQWIEPASTTYNGYHVTTTGSDWGGVELIEMLKIMDLAELSQTNDSYLTNATKLLSLISISRYSDFISAYSQANPEAWGTLHEYFHIDASRKGRLSNKTARLIWNHLSNQEGLDMVNELMTELLSSLSDLDRHREYRRGSSGIVAIDRDGNVCSMAHTANTRPWGTGLFVQGVALPHSGAVFRDFVARAQPGSRIPSGLQPVIIFKKIAKKHSTHANLYSGRVIKHKEILLKHEKNQENLTKQRELNNSHKPTEPFPENVRLGVFMKNKQNSNDENFIRGQSSEPEENMVSVSELNGEVNSRTGFVDIKQTSKKIENKYEAQNHTIKERLNKMDSPNGNKLKKELKLDIQWENEIENEIEDNESSENESSENESSENESSENENRVEYEEMEESEWDNEREPLESEDEYENEFKDGEDEEELETIGGLFDENELNSGKNNSNTTNENGFTSQYVVKSWFRKLVRQLLQREKKKNTSRQIIRGNYKKRRNRQLQPVVALSVIGQSAMEAVLQYINNLLDNGMDAKQASDAPMFCSSTPGSFRQDVRLERFSIDQDVINDVLSRGQYVSEVMHKVGSEITGFGAVLMVIDKKAYGCSHPDSEGFAEGH